MNDIEITIDAITEINVIHSVENTTAIAANILASVENISDDLT